MDALVGKVGVVIVAVGKDIVMLIDDTLNRWLDKDV